MPKKVVVIEGEFWKKRYELLASMLHILDFEFIGLPCDVSAEERQEEQAYLESYKKDPFGEKIDSLIGKSKMKRNPGGILYPFGSGAEVQKIYKKQFAQRKTNHQQ